MDGSGHLLADKTLAMGRRWARAFARQPLSEDQCERVARAYVDQVRHHRTVVFHRDGLVLVRLDTVVQVADAGQLWAFQPQMGDAAHGWTQEALVRAYQEHRGAPGSASSRPWLLTSFNRATYDLAQDWSWQDVAQAFRRAGVAGGSSHDFFPDPAFPEKVRMIKGYALRGRFYQACIGAALRPLRQALAGDALKTVWRTGNVDGALFHWLQAGATSQQRLYRRQALQTQPALLPMALIMAGKLPNQAGCETDPEQPIKPSMLETESQTLIRAIDEGHNFVPALTTLLNRVRLLQHTSTRIHREDRAGFAERALERAQRRQWTDKDVRILTPRKGRATLTYPQVRNHLTVSDLPMAARMVHHLGADRQPRRIKHWAIVARLAHWLEQNQGQMPDGQVAHALQGCPVSWDDPFYQNLSDRLCMVEDTMRHMHLAPQIPPMAVQAATRTLSLRQWFNFSAWAHDRELQIVQDAEAERQAERQAKQREEQDFLHSVTWSPMLPGGRWSHALGNAVELLSPRDTDEEGRRMSHCVGGHAYAGACMEGRARLVSLRSHDLDAAPLSTVELRWDHQRQRPVVAQHFGFHNTAAPETAQRLLRALLRVLPRHPWPEHPQAEQWRRLMQQGYGTPTDELLRPFRATLWGELVRRHPQVQRLVERLNA